MGTDGSLGGVYLAKPTGEVLAEDPTFIEVLIAGKSVYAKPCFSFGAWNAPNKEWLEKYKDEVMVWVCFEHGNDAHPVYIGVMPLNEKVSTLPYLRGKNWKSTEFSYYFDDKEKRFSLSKNDAEGVFERGVEIDGDTIAIYDSKGNILALDSVTGQITFKNGKDFGIRTLDDCVIVGSGEGTEMSIKGTTHIQSIQSILNGMLTATMLVNPATMTATFNPATISILSKEIAELSSNLSSQVKID